MLQFKYLFPSILLVGYFNGQVIVNTQAVITSDSSPDPSPVSIGLLISEPNDSGAIQGAELAVRQANSNGGCSGHPFQLIIRSVEGPWGTGSKESVSLVFEEDVVAIAASLDGRNAHLVEQVAAKTRVTCLSVWASEMTLSQAFVPWHFRCVPNDDQQSASLINEIYKKRGIKNVAVIGTEDYDSRNAVRSFINNAIAMKVPVPVQLTYQSTGRDSETLLKEIERNDIRAVVLFLKPVQASEIIPVLKKQNRNLTLYGSLSITDDLLGTEPDFAMLEGITVVSPGYWFTEEGRAFVKGYQEAFGYKPGTSAAYAYDGLNLIIERVKKYGPDRDKIIDNFTEMNNMTGVTGRISFDAHGNRIGTPDLMIIMDGIPVLIK
jgi:branched-chain amino acid transport system substrate-binding protein